MNLSTKILIGLALGVIAGLELGAEGVGFAKTWIAPFGTIFMNMIKMVIVPLVFSSLVMGVASLGDIKKVGRIGIKTVGYYLALGGRGAAPATAPQFTLFTLPAAHTPALPEHQECQKSLQSVHSRL